MKYKIFEQHLKNEISNTTEAVDINALITNIHSLKKTNNRRIGFWIFSSLIILTFLSFGLNQITNRYNKIENSSKFDSKLIQNNNIKNSAIALNSLSEENIENNENETINTNQDNTLKTKSNSSIIKINTPLLISNNSKSINTNQFKNINNNLNSIINLEKVELKRQNLSDESATILNSKNITSIKAKSNSLIKISPISNKNFGVEGIDRTNFISDPIKCPSFKSKSIWHFTLVSELGLLLPIKQLNNNGASSELFNLRKENEKPLEGLQGAIYGQIGRVKNPFYFKFGLSYSRISDRLKYNYSYTQSDTTQGIISITESENGDTLTIIRGDIITETTIERNLTQHQYFHLIDIPFGIGYSFDMGSFLLGVELGGQFNILTQSRGTILEGVNTLTEIKDADLFKTSLGMTYYGSFNFIKPLTSQSSVYLSARFRYFPSNFSSETNNITQKYDLAGLHLGYMYTFY